MPKIKQLTLISTKIRPNYLTINCEYPVGISTNIEMESSGRVQVETLLSLDFENTSNTHYLVYFRAPVEWFKQFKPVVAKVIKGNIEAICPKKQSTSKLYACVSNPILKMKEAEYTHRVMVDTITNALENRDYGK